MFLNNYHLNPNWNELDERKINKDKYNRINPVLDIKKPFLMKWYVGYDSFINLINKRKIRTMLHGDAIQLYVKNNKYTFHINIFKFETFSAKSESIVCII